LTAAVSLDFQRFPIYIGGPDQEDAMTFLEIVEVLVSTLIVYFALTQVVIPWAKGTLFFPLFRGNAGLEGRLKQAKQDLEDARIETEAEKIEKKAKGEKEKWNR
jgi:hypothetical protein